MQQVLHPYATAGIALVGAGMIAVTPVAAPLPDNHPVRDVALTASADPGDISLFGAWQDVFTTATTNFGTLSTAFSDASEALQDALANNPTLDLNQLIDALTFLGGDQKSFLFQVSAHTLDSLHQVIFAVLTGLEPTIAMPPAEIIPIVNLLSSPLSGVLIGVLGPFISPWVGLINSFEAIFADLGETNPDWAGALQELINIPANMVNGLLNGATLNLDSLIPLIGQSGLLPEGTDISSLSFAFGGLLSPGDVATGVGGVTDGVGGSLLNGVGLDIDLNGNPLDIPGQATGPFAALAGVVDIIAQALAGGLPPLEPASDVATAAGDAVSAFDLSDLLGSL